MKKVIDFISKTSSGMAMGLFATLIVGTIIKQLCSFGDGWQVGIDIATIITNLMGVGIALGVAISMKKDLSVLEIASLLVVGAITSSLNLLAYDNPIPTITVNGGSKNPLLIYAVIICTIYLAKLVLIKKTPIDILLIPFTYIIFGTILGFGLLYPCYYIIFAIQKLVEVSMPLVPELMSIIISVVMGMVLTMPISSVAVCVAIDIGQTPLAAGAALIGCSAQMIGFAAMSFMAKNSIGKSIGVGIGTSMLYWPNIIKKPAIWLPTILASFILGPIGVCLLNTMGTSAGAGMGTCGLVGQISSMEVMGYTNYQTYVSIFVIQILGSIILTLLFDFLFKNVLHLYSNEDLKLD
ncbi:MAG: PTS sugar transporter subunit IIC [Candidatus Onthovivens sp.]|nr:PTS sugar transporter subunit IIC [Candidatus Onthovivens sp.]